MSTGPMTFRIRGRSLGGTVYFTGRSWHWNRYEAKTWKTQKGAVAALAVLTKGKNRSASLFNAEVEEATP